MTEDQEKTTKELLESAVALVVLYRESVRALSGLCEEQQKTLIQQQETIHQLRGETN